MSRRQDVHDRRQDLRALRLVAGALALALALGCASSGGKKKKHEDAGAPTVDAAVMIDAAPPADLRADDQTIDEVTALDTSPTDLARADGEPPPDLGKLTFERWPGTAPVMTVDRANMLGMNVSGLGYLPAAGGQPPVLLAAQNAPSKMYRLTEQMGVWLPEGGDWAAGKTLHFPGGKGSPDAEGLTTSGVPGIVYVASEEDNDKNQSRLSVLRFDTTMTGTSLTATHEWNLTADLPPVDANQGFESVAWVPDSYLVGRGFVDESTSQLYDPARYPDHAGGIFLVALEMKKDIYAYALEHGSGAFHRVATFTSGQPDVMDLAFDADLGAVWAACDDNCQGRITLLAVDTTAGSPTRGHFVVRREFERPATMPNLNNEGITFAPAAECSAGQRRFFWSDDSATGGHALRAGSIPCGPLF
jgi:hypothetical protein